jgi:serine/threonine-protein kinase
VYDTGRSRPGDGIIPYIVMELVQKSALRDVSATATRSCPSVRWSCQGVLDALGYSHKAGIIHRDIKPANVMLTPTGGSR